MNENTASNTVEVQVDTIPPTVTITDAPETIQNGVFSVTITFSEDVTGFTATDIALIGTGTADATATVSGNGSAYTATLTPTGEGTVTVQVPADAAADVGRNGNTPSNTAAVQVDTIPPTVTITDVPDTIQNGTFAVTITFREDVIDFNRRRHCGDPHGYSQRDGDGERQRQYLHHPNHTRWHRYRHCSSTRKCRGRFRWESQHRIGGTYHRRRRGTPNGDDY